MENKCAIIGLDKCTHIQCSKHLEHSGTTFTPVPLRVSVKLEQSLHMSLPLSLILYAYHYVCLYVRITVTAALKRKRTSHVEYVTIGDVIRNDID